MRTRTNRGEATAPVHGLGRERKSKASHASRVSGQGEPSLQLLAGHRKENRTVEVGEISRGIKVMAKELKVPVLALAQLNRDYDRDGRREPRLSDLRESGSIEQDADVVMFIHQPKEDENTVQLIVRKNRGGRTGKVELYFNRPITRFESHANEPVE
jgi:replicative DNA helicase